MAYCALFIKHQFGLIDEETVEQIRKNTYNKLFLGFASYSRMVPFGPTMIVHFRYAHPAQRIAIN
jgi:hypothetical protein